MQYVPDYKISLMAPEQITDDEIKEFQTSLKEVMLYIKYFKNKAKLLEIARDNPDFLSMDRQAAEMINATTKSNVKYPEGKEKVNMCLAIKEMQNENRLEGEIKGAVKTCKNFIYDIDRKSVV